MTLRLLPPAMMVLAVFFIAGTAGAQTEVSLSLPVPTLAKGEAFKTTGQSPEPRILCGLAVAVQGPFMAVAPLTSALKADGGLESPKIGIWKGQIPPRLQRVEKAGCILGGVRLLFVIRGQNLILQQIQPIWTPFRDGAPTGARFPGPALGKPAADKDQVQIKEILVPDNYLPVGLHGMMENRKLTQFSLVVKPLPPAAAPGAEKKAPSHSDPTLPRFLKAPQAPQVPQVKMDQ